jgi:DNA-binding transcriptional ArsR family regulator
MITFVFSLDDLARTRFAISPMWELMSAIRSLRRPAVAATHLPWIRQALPIARELGLVSTLSILPPEGYLPDFLTPPPSTPLASFADELELVRATPVAQIRDDLGRVERGGEWTGTSKATREAAAERRAAFAEHPRRELNRVCEEVEAFWDAALEPHWQRIRTVLEDDLRYRSRRLTEGGPSRLFEDLHPAVRWRGDRLEIDLAFDTVEELGGTGLLLAPSAFQPIRPAAITEESWQRTLIYPSRGLALLWEPITEQGPEALSDLLGRTRADLLSALDTPRSTTQLAAITGVSAGGVSQHLGVLSRSGLVAGERHGRSKLYMRTPAADRLLHAGTDAGSP